MAARRLVSLMLCACLPARPPACLHACLCPLLGFFTFLVVIPNEGEDAKKLRPVLDAIHERSTGNLRVRVNDGREITAAGTTGATGTSAVDVALTHIGVVLFNPKTVVSAAVSTLQTTWKYVVRMDGWLSLVLLLLALGIRRSKLLARPVTELSIMIMMPFSRYGGGEQLRALGADAALAL